MFGRVILFNLTSIINWHVVTTGKWKKIEIDNFCKNSRQVTHFYAIGDLVYVENTGIYRKLDNNNQGPNIINEVFTNCTV